MLDKITDVFSLPVPRMVLFGPMKASHCRESFLVNLRLSSLYCAAKVCVCIYVCMSDVCMFMHVCYMYMCMAYVYLYVCHMCGVLCLCKYVIPVHD